MKSWATRERSGESATMSPGTKPHMDDLLDESLKQTFPASDAVAIVIPRRPLKDQVMAKPFKVGDRVSWNSEAGRVRGKSSKSTRQM
jgi:hypothetical protein